MKTGYLAYITICLAMMTCLSVYSQQKQDDHAFRSGEALYYEVAYNWGIIWVNAGEVYFKVDTIVHENQPAYAFDSYGQSYSFYDWIFKVRDHFQSVALRESLQPVQFKRDTYEGGFEVNNTYQFLNKEQKVIAEIEHSDRPRTADTLDLPFGTLDVLTAIYHARNLNFDTLEPGEKIPVRFIIDGEFYELYIRYQGREVKKNRDGKLYRCIKFSALLVEGTIFKGGEDLVVWVTDDENKVPVMAEARILVGSIKAYLTGFENLKGKMPEVEKE